MDSPAATTSEDVAGLDVQLRQALASSSREEARALAEQLDSDQAAQLFEALGPAELSSLFDLIGDERFADLVVQLDDHEAADVLEQIPAEDAADVLEEIDPDDATDIFSEVEPEAGSDILVEMEPAEAAEIRELLAYPPDTAGGLMTPAFVAISPRMRADQAIAALRRVAEDAETVNYVYVTDPDDRLLGVLSLHKLVLTKPGTPVSELMYTRPVTVLATADQEAAAHVLMEHELLALPVVDEENRILGIITVDDIAEVIEREATEDIERIGGSTPLSAPYLSATPLVLFRKRVVWLLVLFLAQFLTVSIIGHYEGLLREATILSLFIPILIGTGGNIGSQTATTVVRSLAVGEISARHTPVVIAKEASTGVLLGVVMALMMAGRALLAGGGATDVAVTVGVTVFAIAIWAATVGSVLPIVINKMRFDPAVVSAPFISSLVDTTGLIIYFTIARSIMDLN